MMGTTEPHRHPTAGGANPLSHYALLLAWLWLLFVAYQLSANLVLASPQSASWSDFWRFGSNSRQLRDWLENFLLTIPAGLLFGFHFASPIDTVIWNVEGAWAQGIIWGLFVAGIVLLFASTFVINHFDLFGLRQITLNLLKKPYTFLKFKVTFFYKFVRHPLYVGWFLIFWATPFMTAGHLLLAIGMSAYILIAIRYEERDMVEYHGDTYRDYQRKVPMLIPRPGKVHETVKSQPARPLHTT